MKLTREPCNFPRIGFCPLAFVGFMLFGVGLENLKASPENQRATAQKQQALIKIHVGKDVITNHDIEDRCRMIAIFSAKENDLKFMKDIRQQTIQRLIDELIYEQIAERSKMEISSESIQEAMEDYAYRMHISVENFEKALKESGIFSTFQNMIRGKIISSYMLASALPKDLMIVSEKQIDAEIKKIKRNTQKKQYFVSEIIICTNAKTPLKTSVEQTAQNTYQELVQMSQKTSTTSAFQTLAQQLSQGPTASDGGVRGWLVEGQMDRSTENAIKGLKVGTFSKPVLIRHGEYRIFFLSDIKEPGLLPYSQSTVSMCFVTIPFNKKLPEAEQEAIGRKISALKDCTSKEELSANAKEFGYTAEILKKLAHDIVFSVFDLKMNQCLGPFFTGKALELYMPLSVTSSQLSSNVDRKAIKEEIQYRKKYMAAEKIFKDFKKHVLIQEVGD